MWSFRLLDLNGNALGDVRDATDRKFVGAINRAATASFKVRGDNPLLFDLFKQEDRLLEVWEDSTIRFNGYITGVNYADEDGADMGSATVNAADSTFRLAKRLAGCNGLAGTAYTETDKAKIAWKIIGELENEGIYGEHVETGIERGAESEVEAAGSGTYTAGPFVPALACINDLAHGFDGFDWRFAPLDGSHPKLNKWEAKPVLGETKAVRLERGTGRHNLVKVGYIRDLANALNVARHLPDDGLEAEGAEVITKSNTESLVARGRYEEVSDAYGLADKTLREKWCEEVVRVRGNPRWVISGTMAQDDGYGSVPVPWTDFAPGDSITVKHVVEGNHLADGLARVYAIEVEVDDNGNPTYTPVLIDEEGDEFGAS